MNEGKESLYASFNEKVKELTREEIRKRIYTSVYERIKAERDTETAQNVRQLLGKEIIQFTDYSEVLNGLNKGYTMKQYSPAFYFKDVQSYITDYVHTLLLKNFVGIDELEITQVFITLAIITKDESELETALKELALAFICVAGQTNLELRILDRTLLNPLCEALNFEATTYYNICNKFLETLYNTVHTVKFTETPKLPAICYIHGVLNKGLKALTKKVAENLKLPIIKVEQELSHINSDFELQMHLGKLCQESTEEIPFINFYKNFKKAYSTECFMETDFQERAVTSKNISIVPKYMYADYFKTNLFKASAGVSIELSKINIDNLDELLGYAGILLNTFKGKKDVKVTLKNTPLLSLGAIRKLDSRIKELQERYNNHLFFEIFFNLEYNKKIEQKPFNRIYLLSDMHVDYNKEHLPLLDTRGKFIINCGDTSGSADVTIDWIKKSIDAGVFVHGNHLGYGERTPIEDQIEALKEAFPLDGNVSYLNNAYKEYNGIIFIGACLYTDFTVYGKWNTPYYKKQAECAMNDFKVPRTRDGNFIRRLTPNDYVKWYKESVKYIAGTAGKFKSMPVVVLTHFAPLPFSIHPKYERNPLNASFANDLRALLDKNPNIVTWVHGHCIDDKTEVLTTCGWKTYKSIKKSDKVLNLNTSTYQIEEDSINAIINNNYTGKVYHFHSRGNDIRVTENHDMLILNKKTNKITKMEAKELYNKRGKVLVRAAVQTKKGLNLSDNLIRLLVWISADGSLPNKSTHLIRLRLYKERKIKRLQELLSTLKIPYRIYEYGENRGCSINFYLPEPLWNYSFKPIDKRIILCNKKQCDVILEEYANTDGTHNGNSIIIFTSKKEEADIIQLMCITNGYGCSISKRVNKGFKLKSGIEKISYDLNIVKNSTRSIDNPKSTTTVEEVQNEHFWCLNTNNGTLIIRRNGKVNITGNCHDSFNYVYNKTKIICSPYGYYHERDMKSKKGYPEVHITFEDIESGKVTNGFKKYSFADWETKD